MLLCCSLSISRKLKYSNKGTVKIQKNQKETRKKKYLQHKPMVSRVRIDSRTGPTNTFLAFLFLYVEG